jgi:hypothetical protein
VILGIVFGILLSTGNPLGKASDLISPLVVASSLGCSAIILILLGFYLNFLAIIKEKISVLFLRRLSLKFSCFGGTQFALTTLNGADFSNVDLKYARFKKAKIFNCYFQQAKNHHLALTDDTPLEPRKVRDLVIDGIITDKNFSTLDLRGLDFSNLNLQGFDFSHANLSGANLSHTQMTGAILEGWAIDTETRLGDIECRYYYYQENGEKKRMPPEGEEYKAGEFTTIFQHLAKTVSIIAHNAVELAAIKFSVEQVSKERQNDGIQIQSIDIKNGAIVVGIAVPKTEDAGVLHHKIKELTQENVVLINNNHSLTGKLEGQQEQYNKLLSTIAKLEIGDTVMGNKITTNITGSTINNDGFLNFGEMNGNGTQHQS